MSIYNRVAEAKTIFFHGGCPDGIASREILKIVNNKAEYKPFMYDSKNTIIPGSVFVDCCPQNVKEALEQDCVILDHHITNIEKLQPFIESYPDQIMIGDNNKGESGAMLAFYVYKHFYEIDFPTHNYAYLVGLGDTFHKKDTEDFQTARALAYYVQLHGNDWSGIPTKEQIDQAVLLYKLQQKKDERVSKKAIIRELNGLKIGFVGSVHISDVAEILRKKDIDITVGFDIVTTEEGEKIHYSLRSNEKFDISKFAQYYGGGGHKAAAGVFIDYNNSDPIIQMLVMLEEYNEI